MFSQASLTGRRVEPGASPDPAFHPGGRAPLLYVGFCRFCDRNLSWLVGNRERFAARTRERASAELREALRFTGLPVGPEEVALAAYGAALFLALPLVGSGAVMAALGVPGAWVPALAAALLPAAAMVLLSEYPKGLARLQSLRSIGDVPEVTAYLVMSLRLVPSLESAVQFTAESSDRTLAQEFRKLLWNVGLRVHATVEEGLGALADRWGRRSESFKRALHLLRASTAERDEAQRMMTLGRALDVVLDGSRDLMEEMAEKLRQPTTILFSVFVMIPLALVAMLPAAGVVGFTLGPAEVVLLYLVVFPLATFLYGERILRMRPAAIGPAPLPPDHPDLRSAPQARRCVGEALGVGAGAAAASLLLLPAAGLPASLGPLLGAAAGAALFSARWGHPRQRLRKRIHAMEEELPDALLVIGRRVGEGRPPEEALQFAARTLEGGELASALGEASGRLLTARTDLEGALLGEGSPLRRLPSARVRALFHLFSISVRRSPEAAGTAITRLADHLRELRKVEERTRRMLSEVTSTMRTTSAAFAPLIGGVTVALSDTVGRILQRASAATGLLDEEGPAIASAAIPFDFLALAVGLYLLLLAAILVRFERAVEVGQGDDLASPLGPRWATCIGVYVAVLAVSRGMFGGLIQG